MGFLKVEKEVPNQRQSRKTKKLSHTFRAYSSWIRQPILLECGM